MVGMSIDLYQYHNSGNREVLNRGKSYVPEDLITEILSRLPVKSLLRFKCVHKSWYDRVENPAFISKHFKNFDNENCLFYYNIFRYPQQLHIYLSPHATLTDLSGEDLELLLPKKLGDEQWTCTGCFDGLFFIYGTRSFRMALWNPATRESGFLPKLDVSTFPSDSFLRYVGLGFEREPGNNDYKIVAVCSLMYFDYDEGFRLPYDFPFAFIYTSSANCWRELKVDGAVEKFGLLDFTHQHVYLDGVCYWLAYGKKVIVSFHMKEEVFQEILHMPVTSTLHDAALGVFNNTLSTIIFDKDENFYKIWVKKEANWILQFMVGPHPWIERPLIFWKGGSFFIASDYGPDRLFLYDHVTQELENLQVQEPMITIYNYKQCLLPIKLNDT